MNARRSELRDQAGSAYLLAIMVLLILTIVGLALTLTTQSEMQMGENERLLRRSFYSANAGIAISTAKALVVPDLRCLTLDLAEPSKDPDVNLRNRIELTPFTPVQDGWCNLCQVNQDSPFFKINHAVASSSTRIGWKGDPDDPPDRPIPLATERLSVMVAFQPWRMETKGAVDAISPNPGSGMVSGMGSSDSFCRLQEGF